MLDKIKKKWYSLKENDRKIILSIVLFILVLGLIPGSLAMYKGNTLVNVTTISGDMISDISIDTDPNYIENGIPYFYVDVKNYRENGYITLLSSTAFDYDLVITNKEDSNGLFKYIDESGNGNSEFSNELRISNCHLGSNISTNRFKIYVSREGSAKTTVNYDVKLEAFQAKSK